ncbi:MAG: patatin-like phospholipase family protein [Polyangiaceae bacterium]|nr:patatin-like phospholipase family protein [Polyangiaceae bacterium]
MSTHDSTGMARRLAVVLAGGGARGAYEAGVLSYIFDELTGQRGHAPEVDFLCGTSVGAINCAYLASHLEDPVFGARRLVDVWMNMKMSDVLGFGMRQTLRLPRVLMGGADGAGLFDVSPMADFLSRQIPWRAISRNLRRGRLHGLSLSATEVSSGRTTLFMQLSPETPFPTRAPMRTIIRPTRIGPLHTLASAAIPLLFPPVSIDGQLYVDGAVRQSTPIAPALRLGASHALVIGTSQAAQGDSPKTTVKAPSAAFLLGKMMNALLLDHLDSDVGMVNLLNNIVGTGEAAFGVGFDAQFNAAAARRGGHMLKPIQMLVIRPSQGIGYLAAQYVRQGRLKTGPLLTRRLFQMMDVGVGDDADLTSYFLFDGGFARELVELGRADARAMKSEILGFLDAAESPDPVGLSPGHASSSDGSWSLPPGQNA